MRRLFILNRTKIYLHITGTAGIVQLFFCCFFEFTNINSNVPINSIYFKTMKQISTAAIKLFFIPVLVLYSLLFSIQSMAQGNLLVTPKRVVFEGNKRSEELNLANVGKDSATYLISLIQIRMNEDGKFERITQPDPGQNFADRNLRFFPRTVTLAPGEAQTIKLQIVKASELPPGEYRSHLYFRANPPSRPLGEEIIPEKDSVLSVRLIPVFGISIPVIIRNGESTATVKISEVVFQMTNDSMPAVNMTFNRSGNMSVYGDIAVDHISLQGKTTRVGIVKGLAIYTPNTKRRFHLPLEKNKTVDYHSGKLHLVYSDQSSRAIKLAEQEIMLK